MTIGDKIIVTYSDGDQLIGPIIGETEKMWKVDFDGEEKTRRVRKSMDIQLVGEVKEEEVAEEVLEPDLTEEEVDELIEVLDEEMLEEADVPTDEEFAEPVGEPKKKIGMVIAAGIILGGLAALLLLRVLGVL